MLSNSFQLIKQLNGNRLRFARKPSTTRVRTRAITSLHHGPRGLVYDHVDVVALVVAVHVRTKALRGLNDPRPIHRLFSNACDGKTRVRRVNAPKIEETRRRTLQTAGVQCTRIGRGWRRQGYASAEYQDGVRPHVGNRQQSGVVSATDGTIDARRIAILAGSQHTQTGPVDGLVEGVVEPLSSFSNGVIH